MRLNHKNLYKHTNRTWHNSDGARGKGFATKRVNKEIEKEIKEAEIESEKNIQVPTRN